MCSLYLFTFLIIKTFLKRYSVVLYVLCIILKSHYSTCFIIIIIIIIIIIKFLKVTIRFKAATTHRRCFLYLFKPKKKRTNQQPHKFFIIRYGLNLPPSNRKLGASKQTKNEPLSITPNLNLQSCNTSSLTTF